MHLALTDSEIPLFALVVSIGLGSLLGFFIWAVRLMVMKWNEVRNPMNAIEVICRAVVFVLIFLWELVSAIVTHFLSTLFPNKKKGAL